MVKDMIIAVHAYWIGETAMLSLDHYENFSGFRNQDKHNAFVINVLHVPKYVRLAQHKII